MLQLVQFEADLSQVAQVGEHKLQTKGEDW